MKGLDILLLKNYIGHYCPSEQGFKGEDQCTDINSSEDKCLECWKSALEKEYKDEK